MTVTKDTTVGAVLREDQATGRIFMMHGMGCFGCPHAAAESIEAACAGHGVPCEPLVKALNEYFEKKDA